MIKIIDIDFISLCLNLILTSKSHSKPKAIGFYLRILILILHYHQPLDSVDGVLNFVLEEMFSKHFHRVDRISLFLRANRKQIINVKNICALFFEIGFCCASF
ncbi:hypothetical protein NH340_JMT05260 [Sarcoptes scabiei]|nr:hypothetical protein NH340_JMT05260 [Sarcoptes scabiei]